MSNLVFHDSDEYINTYDIFDQVKPDVGVGVGTAKGIKYARLFSAAPDLLAACQELTQAMVDYQMEVDDEFTHPPYKHTKMMERARAALALAGVTP